ncbi:MAG TPA: ATP-binding cassette domain-containing protein [Candidatus Binataceae bacterium]|nr:ATP-binding cassette domain-containing protein [Candidatus Binataceae bacterium]
MEDLIRAENLVVRFGDHTVLDDVSMRLGPREILVILGASGCGKTTLLRTLVGLRAPDAGHVLMFGRDLYALDNDERDETLKRVGMLFQSGALFSSLTLEENIAFPLVEHRHVAPEIAAIIARMKLALVGLETSAALLPSEISGGMKKRAGLARALALDPEVLLFDEPSAGLDPVTARALDDLIVGLKQRLGVAMVVVTHELASIETIADRALMLDRGKVIAEGTISKLRAMDNPQVHAFFAREAKRDPEGDSRPIVGLINQMGE